MIYLKLFLEFFYIGIFSFGGGYATIPFLYHISDKYMWYTHQQLVDMIAVSSVTPGPLGVNVATYTGFTTSGILGSLIATTSVVLPSFILVIIVSKILENFKQNKTVQAVIYSLKPAGCGLLAAVLAGMAVENFNLKSIILFVIILALSFGKKRDPIFYLGIAALAGLVAGIFKIV